MRNRFKLLAISVGALILGGCATTPSSTVPYPNQMASVRQDLSEGGLDVAVQALQVGVSSRDSQLYLMEQGRILQMQRDYADSINAYDQVVAVSGQQLLTGANANQSFSQAIKSAMQGQGNDRPYQIQPYEMILVYQNEALDYLAQGKINEALADFRQADDLKDYLDINYLNSANAPLEKLKYILIPPYPSYETLLGNTYNPTTVSNSLQNGLIDLIASMAFYNSGDKTAANQQMQRALENSPMNNALLSKQAAKIASAANADQSQVWVMLEENFVPLKVQKGYPVLQSAPIAGVANIFTYTMMMPIYATPATPLSFSLSANGTNIGFTPFLNIGDLAAASLREQYPHYATDGYNAVSDEYNDLTMDESDWQYDSANNPGAVPGDLIQLQSDAVDRPTAADLRSWSTLPLDVQLAEVDLPAGTHTLTVTSNGQTVVTCSADVKQNKITLMWVNTQAETPVCVQLLGH